MVGTIDRVVVRGFRSLADVELLELPGAAVLIGANGAGKSNFVRFFEMLRWMLRSRRLEEFVVRQGGADDQLHCGARVTPCMEAELSLRTDSRTIDYRFVLDHANPDRLVFADEALRFASPNQTGQPAWQRLGSGQTEAEIVGLAHNGATSGSDVAAARAIVGVLGDCAACQFHDTSDVSPFKRRWEVEENAYLLSHGGNLAPVLLRLLRDDRRRYDWICEQIGRILPGFDRFELEESYGKVPLRWKASGSDKTFGAHLTSDGSLRFFALVTLLSLADEMLPGVLLLDEPELGLHPAAIALVAAMIRSLSVERQIIVATQSPLLVNAFDLEEAFVLEQHKGRTQVRRLASEDFSPWLEDDFTTGELWQKNLLGGRP